MGEGFFSRWSRRKVEADKGGVPIEPGGRIEPPPPPSPNGGGSEPPPPPLGEGRGGGRAAPEQPAAPVPTLEDAHSLTPQSDFRRFVSADVPPDVKNTALKKLFADPHFNIQDGLDVYIDDYSRPDPIPEAMLKQLAASQFLKLFDTPEESQGREVADAGTSPAVAQSAEGKQAVPNPDHADPDLRLQQDHAPGPPGPGQGTE